MFNPVKYILFDCPRQRSAPTGVLRVCCTLSILGILGVGSLPLLLADDLDSVSDKKKTTNTSVEEIVAPPPEHQLFATIEAQEAELWQTALDIWKWAEPGYQETKSTARLQELLTTAEFQVTPQLAEIPTAFLAEYGSGKPIIAILGEFDALPGLAQDPVPYRSAENIQSYGHGCGHHLFGTASAGAAIAIANEMKQGNLQGTIRFYGCPAEEGGAAKAFLVQAGLFQDCDAVLHWHPSNRNAAGARSSLARIAVRFQFNGAAAHAAGAPEEGRSALDAVALTNHAAELLREHIPDSARIHYVITNGGQAPNVVPEVAEVYYYVRHADAEVVQKLYERLLLCAEAGALATETKLTVLHEGGILNLLPNLTLSEVIEKNLTKLNDLKYNDEEQLFAAKLQETLLNKQPITDIREVYNLDGITGNGSTDVGDVSWIVPTAGFNTACWVPGTPAHSWQATACGGTSIARKGMTLAMKTLAASAWEIYKNPELIATAQQEFKERTARQGYKTLMQPGQKPPLDYRKQK
ncbi:p-aminobenzoyl-glutamate hydrolase subunit B [Polystyrenella longa]|uniref:p-aminobenzoyl-glutamate hydrolase subunit B n=1 Tax=Polystyrenella longa TaxID=2528007 RepID=A0A518CSK0_9PLAN|nr:amidohydrolase [Polystyrenella longa]QDU82203.1 p-aminobenzoyl-glutamate hydrolase subunit B [Polystyrenella longa]